MALQRKPAYKAVNTKKKEKKEEDERENKLARLTQHRLMESGDPSQRT